MEPKKAHKPWSWKEWEAYHWRASLPNWHASGVGFTVCVAVFLRHVTNISVCPLKISNILSEKPWNPSNRPIVPTKLFVMLSKPVLFGSRWPSWRDPWWLSRLSLTESDRSLPVLWRQLASKGGVPAGLRRNNALEHVGASTRIDPVLRR